MLRDPRTFKASFFLFIAALAFVEAASCYADAQSASAQQNGPYLSNFSGTSVSLKAPQSYNLTVTKSGEGTGLVTGGFIHCGPVCSHAYNSGMSVPLSAIPDAGSSFAGWIGCNNFKNNQCVVIMTGDRTVVASFDVAATTTLASVNINPGSVKGGQIAACTVTLTAPAPPGGVGIAISSDHPDIVHPQLPVVVQGGRTSVVFGVNTFPVKADTPVTITASAGSSQVSGMFTVSTKYH